MVCNFLEMFKGNENFYVPKKSDLKADSCQ